MGHSGAGAFGYSHLTSGYAGGQAEYVRVPFADVGGFKVPDGLTDEQVLFLGDSLLDECEKVVLKAWGGRPRANDQVRPDVGATGRTAPTAVWIRDYARGSTRTGPLESVPSVTISPTPPAASGSASSITAKTSSPSISPPIRLPRTVRERR